MNILNSKWNKFLTLLILGVVLFGNKANAFTINPYYLVFEGRTKIKTFTVRNSSNEEKSYKVSLRHMEQTSKGGYNLVKKESERLKFADDFLLYGPKSFSLQPKESKTIRIQSRHLTSDKPDGEYRSHLYVLEQSKVQQAKSSKKTSKGIVLAIGANTGISIPLVVRKGNLFGEVSISNFKVIKTEDGGAKLILSLEKTGSTSFKGKLEIFKDGDELISLQNGLAIYNERDNIILEKALSNIKTGEPISYESLRGEDILVRYTTEKVFNKKEIIVEREMKLD